MRVFPRYQGPPLLTQICGVENLTAAWRQVRRNIQFERRTWRAGVDNVTIRDFEDDWATQMTCLATELHDGTYRPALARHFTIAKKDGGTRSLALLTVRDRIAQRATQQRLAPVFEPLFLECSYGCRPGVGVPEAVERVRRHAACGSAWAVDADIAAYFDTID